MQQATSLYGAFQTTPFRGGHDLLKLFGVNGFVKVETVIFLIESPHMKHKHRFAVKVGGNNEVIYNAVNAGGVGDYFANCDRNAIHIWEMKWCSICSSPVRCARIA